MHAVMPSEPGDRPAIPPPAGDRRVCRMRHLGSVVTSSAQQHRDRFSTVGRTLRRSMPVPTDTFITDDIPLLLTKLSQIPATRDPRDAR